METTMKCALITGGSRGIGKAVSIKLALELNYHVLINYQSNENAALETLKEINDGGGRGELIKFDVSNDESVKSALENWEAMNPSAIVEVIVNNAGITRDGLFMWMTKQDWNDVLNTSLGGFFNVTNF